MWVWVDVFLAGIEPGTLRITKFQVPRSPPLSYGDGWITDNPLGPSCMWQHNICFCIDTDSVLRLSVFFNLDLSKFVTRKGYCVTIPRILFLRVLVLFGYAITLLTLSRRHGFGFRLVVWANTLLTLPRRSAYKWCAGIGWPGSARPLGTPFISLFFFWGIQYAS